MELYWATKTACVFGCSWPIFYWVRHLENSLLGLGRSSKSSLGIETCPGKCTRREYLLPGNKILGGLDIAHIFQIDILEGGNERRVK